MIDDNALASIERLHKMKTEGIITEADFEKAKSEILSGQTRATTSKPTVASPSEAPKPEDLIEWALLPLKRYADFKGRSGRREFWSFHIPLIIALMITASGAGSSDWGYEGVTASSAFFMLMFIIVLLGSIVPVLALQVRRFHDMDKSGLLALLNLIPYFGLLVVYVMMMLPGTEGDNQYGPAPLG
ncbi:DUF805 domain-containing protein [Croceicoccus sp. Ery15]|uniref:DUF805 domain-containing protein n=1 Tax=Croceicoccus sp. Ery15 TaxID=1703338 RepID=UPI001E4623ED|nr:DUF805 domain-containing protein [Croceicoccus sp. Ery15]